MKEILQRINNGYDGIIRKFDAVNFNQASIEISCFDKETGGWINVIFNFSNIKELNLFQKMNTSSQILSDGIRHGEVEGLYYLDFNPYLDLDDENTIDDIRKSDVYFIAESISFEISSYADFE